MITAGSQTRRSTSDHAPTTDAVTPEASSTTGAVPAVRSRLSVTVDIACSVLFIALGVAAAFPLVWGLALHQTPLAVSAISAELMCVLVLLNRLFPPPAARLGTVPFLAALEERTWVLISCLICAATSAATLITYWPGTAG